MEKDRSSKVIAIVALLVAAVGLSVGFAAFTATLTINPSATVKGDENQFKVQFSTETTTHTTGSVTGQKDGDQEPTDVNFTAEDAELDETTVSNLKATFTKPGQNVTYTFYVRNDGQIPAYLNKINFSKAEPQCTSETATKELVDAACKKVKMELKYDSQAYSETSTGINSLLEVNSNKTVTVKLSIEDGATAVDGDFEVDFGSITFDYSTKSAS